MVPEGLTGVQMVLGGVQVVSKGFPAVIDGALVTMRDFQESFVGSKSP